jgi:phosphatidylserine/phosphatidylglycerophosphate/cardiolipin synthase-like enzyme
MFEDFDIAVELLIRKAPTAWLDAACEALKRFPAGANAEQVLKSLPTTHNADLSFLMAEVICLASSQMSWEALGWSICTAATAYSLWQQEQHLEMLWAGPLPANQIPARRIDQTLYDLIANAKREILLVTFAAAKIERLTNELLKAAQRGVPIRLILEFEQSSEGQLSYDALKAFPSALTTAAEVFYWPVEKRGRNPAGRPGKLHAKLAIVDDTALVSSANLTDDAFNRNLEVGVMVKSPEFLKTAKGYINSLIFNGILKPLNVNNAS